MTTSDNLLALCCKKYALGNTLVEKYELWAK